MQRVFRHRASFSGALPFQSSHSQGGLQTCLGITRAVSPTLQAQPISKCWSMHKISISDMQAHPPRQRSLLPEHTSRVCTYRTLRSMSIQAVGRSIETRSRK